MDFNNETPDSTLTKKPGVINKILDLFERVGNKLPDPVSIFAVLCLSILVISYLCNKFGVTAVNPITKEVIHVVDLTSKASLQQLLTSMINVFQTFPPLGLVLVSMIGIGVADKSGLLETFLNVVMVKIPKWSIYYAVIIMGLVFTGIGDAGFVILPPLAALIFLKIGKNPIIGVLLAYAGAAIGFCSGLFITLNDILITSFSIPAAQMVDPTFMRSPTMNLFFNLTNAFLQMFIIAFITKKFIEPRFPFDANQTSETNNTVGELERKGLAKAGLTFLLYAIFIIFLMFGTDFLRDSTGSLVSIKSPFMGGLIIIMTVAFMIPGIIFGKTTNKIKTDKDVVKMVGQSLGEMGGYIFIVFAASQFLSMFTKSNLGIVIAVKGADALRQASFSGIPLMIMFILLIGFINLFIGSASAKWAILSPIFIPMFMMLGYDPALTQMAYRIGDSSTNMISPLFPYLPLLLAVCKKYDKNFGIGTLVANMIPYALATLLGSITLLIIFLKFQLPLGI